MRWYNGKKAIITGGSSGIGKAAAQLLVAWGADVCIWGRDTAKLEQAVGEVRPQALPGIKVLSMPVDVADRRQVRVAAVDVVKELGGIDIVINCAGIAWAGHYNDVPDGIWDSIMQIDYMGTTNTVRAFTPYLIEQRSGTIVNVASVLGYMGVFGYTAYAPAKFALVGFSESLRQELLPYDISISVVYPPDTDTPQWHEENRTKPAETRILAGTIKVLSAEKVARSLLRGAAKGRFTILPGFMNKFTYSMNRYLPSVVWMIVSGTLRKYWKNKKKES